MQNATFPPTIPSPQAAYILMLHISVLVCAGAALLAVCWPWPRERPTAPGFGQILLWLAASVFAPMFMINLDDTFPDTVVIEFVLFVWLCSFIGIIRTLLQSPGRIAACLGWLSLTGFAILLIPTVPRGRAMARLVQCTHRLQQILNAHQTWAEQHEGELPPSIVARPGGPPCSWRVELLPFLDVRDYAGYQFATAWDAPENLPAGQKRMEGYSCPTQWYLDNEVEQGRWPTSYAVVTGDKTIHPQPERVLRLSEVTDGLSATVLMVENCAQRIAWTEPRDLPIDQYAVTIQTYDSWKPISPTTAISSSAHRNYPAGHRGGAHMAMADGSVRFVSQHIDPAILKMGLTATGGETIPKRQERAYR